MKQNIGSKEVDFNNANRIHFGKDTQKHKHKTLITLFLSYTSSSLVIIIKSTIDDNM